MMGDMMLNVEKWHKECKFKKSMNKTKLQERKDYNYATQS